MIEAVREVTENAALRVNIWGGESVTQKASGSNNNRDPHLPDEEIWRRWKVAVTIRTRREDSCKKVGDSLHKYRGCIAVKTISAHINCDTICGIAAHLQYTSSSLRLRSVSARSFVIKESGFLLIARTNSKESCQTPKPLDFESLDPVPYGSGRCGWIRPRVRTLIRLSGVDSDYVCLYGHVSSPGLVII